MTTQIPLLSDIEQSFFQITSQKHDIIPPKFDPVAFLSHIQERQTPKLDIIRFCLFAGSRDKQFVTSLKKEMNDIIKQTHPLALICEELDTDLRLYELRIDEYNATPTEKEQALALTYGMMSIEEDLDLIITGSLSTPLSLPAPQNLSNSIHDDINAIIGCIFSSYAAQKPIALMDENALYAASILHHYNPKILQTCFYVGSLNNKTQNMLEQLDIFALTTDEESFTGEAIATVLSRLKESKPILSNVK